MLPFSVYYHEAEYTGPINLPYFVLYAAGALRSCQPEALIRKATDAIARGVYYCSSGSFLFCALSQPFFSIS